MFADRNPTIDAETINVKFKEKGVTLPCPRCGHQKFNFVGETILSLSPSSLQNLLFESQIPIIIIGCANCGFLIQHAKAPLGLSRSHGGGL